MDFSAPDRAMGLGKVLWRRTRPGEPVPRRLEEEAARDLDEEAAEQRRPLPVPLQRWPVRKETR
jgi:hypothetical protein